MANKTVYPYGTGGQLPASVGIVNDLVTGGVDKALSAQQGVVLNGRLTNIEDKFSGSDIVTEIDLSSYSQIKFNLENPSAWAASNTYKSELIPAEDLGGDKLRFVAETFKFSYAFLKSNNASAGVAPDLCTGKSVVTIAVGESVVEDIPEDCNFLYVYVSSNSNAIGKIHLYSIVHTSIPEVLTRSDVVDNLNSDSISDPLSANQGNVLYGFLKSQDGTETIEKTNNNAEPDDVKAYSSQTKIRGYILIERGNASEYGIELSIGENSPIKFGMVLSANVPGQTAVYDSGWKSSGTYSITQQQGNDTVKYIFLSFTYISGDTGEPTFLEISQYATFRLYAIRTVYTGLLPQVAEIEQILSEVEAGKDDFHILKCSQDVYSLGVSQNGIVPCFTVYDLFTNNNMQDLQSVVVDQEKKRLILNRADIRSKMLDFSAGVFEFDELFVGDIGHGNDACLIGDYMWVAGGNALDSSNIKRILTYIDLSISDNINGGTQRVVGGISKYNDNDNLLLAAFDYRGGTNSEGDLLLVYKYQISTGTLTELFSTQWNGWFIQGATYIGGYLYIATNMLPNGSAYTGIRVWKIDAVSWQLKDPVEFSGRYEPEGIDSMYEDNTPVLYMGMFSGQTSPKQCKILKLKAF